MHTTGTAASAPLEEEELPVATVSTAVSSGAVTVKWENDETTATYSTLYSEAPYSFCAIKTDQKEPSIKTFGSLLGCNGGILTIQQTRYRIRAQQQEETVDATTNAFHQLALSPSPDKRKFTVNGSIDKRARSLYFFIETTAQNQDLYDGVRRGEYVMLYGPRAVGKSTRMLQACDDLTLEFHCMNVSLHDIDIDSPTNFWSSLSRSLNRKYNHLGLYQVTTGTDFNDMWYSLKGDKKFVLFIDEFDALEFSANSTTDSILGTFRGLKQSAQHHQLQCVVIVGVFSIVRLNTRRTSPFNVGEAVAAPLLTYEQVDAMFCDYMRCKQFQIQQRVVQDVYERTGGHAGLVNMCGKAIDEKIRPTLTASSNDAGLSFPKWLNILRRDLAGWLRNFPTMARLVTDLSGTDELHRNCRKALSERFLCRDAPVPLNAVDGRVQDRLESVGMVRKVDADQLVVSNSIVRMLAIWEIVPQDRRDMTLDTVPKTPEGQLDMLQLLLKSASYFPTVDLFNAVTWSYKKAGRGGDRKVPHEYFYQSQLASIIRASLPKEWQFFPEVRNDGNRKRIDFVVESVFDDASMRFVLELEATSLNKELVEHYDRAKKYGKMISAGLVWVVHYSAVKLEAKSLPIPPEGVHVLHLMHETTSSEKNIWSALYHDARGPKSKYSQKQIPPKTFK